MWFEIIAYLPKASGCEGVCGGEWETILSFILLLSNVASGSHRTRGV